MHTQTHSYMCIDDDQIRFDDQKNKKYFFKFLQFDTPIIIIPIA